MPTKLFIIHWLWVFLLVGCTDIKVQEERKTETSLEANEKISFILDRSNIEDEENAKEIEVKIEKCIDKALKKLVPPIQTVSAETFRKTVFPGIDYLFIPSKPDSIIALLNDPDFKNRITSLGLRYLLILQGKSSFMDQGGGLGPGFLLFTWDKESKMSACVIDLKQGCKAGDVQTIALGHGFFAIFIFPFGLPAISEGPACKALGNQVAIFITGNRKNK